MQSPADHEILGNAIRSDGSWMDGTGVDGWSPSGFIGSDATGWSYYYYHYLCYCSVLGCLCGPVRSCSLTCFCTFHSGNCQYFSSLVQWVPVVHREACRLMGSAGLTLLPVMFHFLIFWCPAKGKAYQRTDPKVQSSCIRR